MNMKTEGNCYGPKRGMIRQSEEEIQNIACFSHMKNLNLNVII